MSGHWLDRLERPLAYVLPGGGALGAYQAGVLAALHEVGVRPDLLVGVSAGSVNAALAAWHSGDDGIAQTHEIWRTIRRRDVLRLQPSRVALALSGRRPSLLDNRYGFEWLERLFGRRRIEDAPVPVAIVATDLGSGEPALLRDGPVARAILASTAFPGVYPPVEIGGRRYIDGGVTADVPLELTAALGARSALVVQVPPFDRSLPEPTSAIDILLRSATFGVEAHGRSVLARPPIGLTVIEIPAVPSAVTTFTIDGAAASIDLAYDAARAWLADAPPAGLGNGLIMGSSPPS